VHLEALMQVMQQRLTLVCQLQGIIPMLAMVLLEAFVQVMQQRLTLVCQLQGIIPMEVIMVTWEVVVLRIGIFWAATMATLAVAFT